ncbi:hypothetical protein T492DRAFT_983996 [Pavlovales sp. CCMP2436]|nr:hypothetical protein T492DRAFT_983996 [Pavlovales sp. CCMP2436]
MGDYFDEGGAQDLQQFVLLAQSARGAACVALIKQVLSHPKIYVFGELLAVQSVQDLATTEHAAVLALLNSFAYGTWADLPPATATELEPAMALKLRKLTVVSMCASANMIAYDVLQRATAIDSVRELEDLLISLIYEGLLRGKLDQRAKKVDVAHAIGRDVHPDELPRMAAKLQQWRGDVDMLGEEGRTHARIGARSHKSRHAGASGPGRRSQGDYYR